MRSWRSTHNLIAVSANAKETAINTEQTLDTSLLVDLSTAINLEPRRESNADEATGKEEADAIYDLGGLSMVELNFSKAQPQHIAFLLAYGLGSASVAAAGSGYEHTITPIDGDVDNYRSLPSFTAAQRYGATVLKRRFASMFVDSAALSFAADQWVSARGTIKGTGKVADNITEETISAADNVTQITLAANAVEGSSAAERLQNVQRIRVELTAGVWSDVTPSAVSAATPAVITIPSQGGAGTTVSYKILYIPAESGWMTFPSRVVETPLRVSQMTVTFGGTWTGSAFSGGRSMGPEIRSIEYNLANSLELEYTPGTGGQAYANRVFRPARVQTLKLTREFRDYILQQHIDDNDSFGVYILAQGAVFDSPHAYQVELIFPKCGVLSAPISVDGKRLAEAGDLTVLQDDTYGSVIAKVKNLVSAYAA